MKEKLTIGIFSLTGCEGCCFAILDWPKEFVALKSRIEIKKFRLFEEEEYLGKFDIAFVEGCPLTGKDREKLQEIRRQSRIVVAMGSCAVMAGIYHLKHYQDANRAHKFVYHDRQGIENLDANSISKLVKVDFVLPGCPINAQEFFRFVEQFCIGKQPKIKQNPVCCECQTRGFDCVLQKGEACLGPITLGGCEAICLKSKQGCWGCRGLVEDAEISSLVKKLREEMTNKEISQLFEVFGIKEMMNEV